MIIENTPVEEYFIGQNKIYVKREDLYMTGAEGYPRLAKLRGARPYIKRLQEQEQFEFIGCFDTRISHAGQGVSAICRDLGIKCVVGFPMLKAETEYAENHKVAAKNGATLHPMPGGRTNILYWQFRAWVERNGGICMPLGLVCRETVEKTKEVANTMLMELIEKGINIKSIVLSTGTATIATGVHLGSFGYGVKTYGVSCGMSTTEQLKRMKYIAIPEQLHYDWLQLIEPEFDYYEPIDISEMPFPSSKWYDGKAYNWLKNHINELMQPVLFWNIGQS